MVGFAASPSGAEGPRVSATVTPRASATAAAAATAAIRAELHLEIGTCGASVVTTTPDGLVAFVVLASLRGRNSWSARESSSSVAETDARRASASSAHDAWRSYGRFARAREIAIQRRGSMRGSGSTSCSSTAASDAAAVSR